MVEGTKNIHLASCIPQGLPLSRGRETHGGGTSALQVTIQINIQLPEGCKRAFISTPNRRRIFLRRCSSVRNRRGLEPNVFPKYKITCDPLTFSLVPPWGSHLWLREECLMTKAIHGTSLTSAVLTGLFIIFVCILYFVSIAVEMLKAWCVWLKGIKGTPFLNSLWGSELMRRISCFFSYSHKETNACLRLRIEWNLANGWQESTETNWNEFLRTLSSYCSRQPTCFVSWRQLFSMSTWLVHSDNFWATVAVADIHTCTEIRYF